MPTLQVVTFPPYRIQYKRNPADAWQDTLNQPFQSRDSASRTYAFICLAVGEFFENIRVVNANNRTLWIYK